MNKKLLPVFIEHHNPFTFSQLADKDKFEYDGLMFIRAKVLIYRNEYASGMDLWHFKDTRGSALPISIQSPEIVNHPEVGRIFLNRHNGFTDLYFDSINL